jgi:hypothetical protein
MSISSWECKKKVEYEMMMKAAPDSGSEREAPGKSALAPRLRK